MSASLNAVLFDLDGTLLGNDLSVFMPRYFERLSAAVGHLVPRREFVRHLLAATQVMLNNDGRAANEEVFAEAFYPRLGRARAEMEPLLLDFYRRAYPLLRAYTERRPEARVAVQAAFDLGYDVVIATNPLFPEVATRERLAWAGVADFPYRLVTTYENSRACKPNLRYYRDICTTIDREPAACLMVGNEPTEDIVAGALGCETFLVVEGDRPAPAASAPEPTYAGKLADVPAVLAAGRNGTSAH
ncbi:MAG TPA: HAD family hydrolase [Anaerolineae bacterium]